MIVLSWLLSLSFLIIIMIESVTFQRATVCRQEAWLKGTELLTRSLLTKPSPYERAWHLSCRLSLVRKQEKVTWQRLPYLRSHRFELFVSGQL